MKLRFTAFAALLLAAFCPLRCTFGQTTDVYVSGFSGPWLWQVGGLNYAYAYGPNDESAPTILSVAPSQQMTITYLSGTESAGPGWPFVSAQGDTAVAVNNLPDYNGLGPFPSYYMPTADFPIFISELVGTFADSSGDVISTPFPVGLSTTVVAPFNASQLQLGINDTLFSDNSGGYNVQVTENTVPEPTSTGVLALAAIFLCHRRR